MQPLAGIKLVSIAFNLPGPAAVWQLHAFGAEVIKVEPPGGDPLARQAPDLYRQLAAGQKVIELDLKDPGGQAQLDAQLARADLLVTSSLPDSLVRLGLAWDRLHGAFPRLCQVALVGFAPPNQQLTGHDLTYQAALALVSPPDLPPTLWADMAGAQTAVSQALAALLERERTGTGVLAYVPIAGALEFFALPARHGLTAPGGPLGGGRPFYNLYPTRDGWLAVAALEPHFWAKIQSLLNLRQGTYEEFRDVLATRTAHEWERWAAENRLPLAAVK